MDVQIGVCRGVSEVPTRHHQSSPTAMPAPFQGAQGLSQFFCTSQQILDTNHKKIYRKTLSVSQLYFHDVTHGIGWALDSLMNKQDAAH